MEQVSECKPDASGFNIGRGIPLMAVFHVVPTTDNQTTKPTANRHKECAQNVAVPDEKCQGSLG
jgi:hypothetical protein